MNESKFTTPSTTTELQSRRERVDALRRKLQRHDAAPQLQRIGQLAAAIGNALQDIAELMEMGDGKTGPVDPFDDADSLDWPAFLQNLAGWRFNLDVAAGFLDCQFTANVRDALKEAELLDDDDDAEADAPAVNSPPAKSSMSIIDTHAELPPGPCERSSHDDTISRRCRTLPADELPPAKTRPYWLE